MNGTSWLLGAGYSWQSADSKAGGRGTRQPSAVASARGGLRLAALLDGPFGLLSPDGSLGGLTLPRGVASDGETVYVLSADGSRVYRYDALHETLDALANVGVEGLEQPFTAQRLRDPRRFQGAQNIAIHGGALYVADRIGHRVQVFELETLALLHIYTDLEDPIDVAAGPDGVYVLDRARSAVYRMRHDRLERVVGEPSRRARWSRIAVDRDGYIYLVEGSNADTVLAVRAPAGRKLPADLPAQLLDPAEVRDRFDPPAITSDAIGELVLPERLADPCGLRRPVRGARRYDLDGKVYLIDPETRQLQVRLPDGRLRHRFGPYAADDTTVPSDSLDAWSPVDLALIDGCVLILDERHQTIYSHQPGSELLRKRLSAAPDRSTRWRRLAHDGLGCLLLWDGIASQVDRVDLDGALLGQVATRDARAHFPPPPVPAKDERRDPLPRLSRDGSVRKRKRNEPAPQPSAYARSGVWVTRWLDSDIYDCQWHLIELSLAKLPAGCSVVVRTRTSNTKQDDEDVLASLAQLGSLGSWRSTGPITGTPQPDPGERWPEARDLLVTSGPGQYLQLMVELAGSQVDTPQIESLRVRFPRESLLQYLPAIYSAPEEQRAFLEQYLAIMQSTWSAIEHDVASFERFFDPDTVPANALAYLASWLDLTLEGTWSAEDNRSLLQALPELVGIWGTPSGMQAWLRVYLAKLGGMPSRELEEAGLPGIVESFVERRRLMLNRADTATLGSAEALFSPSVERRFQVGVYDREGDIELVSVGDPDLDIFRHFAHRFRIYVPAAWIRTPDDEALLRRAVAAQAPAHTSYELVLVEPRFRIGEQSTIGLDTVIGAALPSTLVCSDIEEAPSRPPHDRLGFDVQLGCARPDGSESLNRVLI